MMQTEPKIALISSGRWNPWHFPHKDVVGDACLPNFILKDASTFSCFIDLGLAGLSDRHIDLYWATWSLTYNLSDPKYAELFIDYYGRKDVDIDKLRLIAAFEAFS